MAYHTRLEISKAFYGLTGPRRLTALKERLAEERKVYHASPAGSIDADLARRNIADLEKHVEMTEANEKIRQRREQEKQQAREAGVRERNEQLAAAEREEVRRAYFGAAPHATEAEFERDLPGLLAEHRRQKMATADEAARQQLRRVVRSAF